MNQTHQLLRLKADTDLLSEPPSWPNRCTIGYIALHTLQRDFSTYRLQLHIHCTVMTQPLSMSRLAGLLSGVLLFPRVLVWDPDKWWFIIWEVHSCLIHDHDVAFGQAALYCILGVHMSIHGAALHTGTCRYAYRHMSA